MTYMKKSQVIKKRRQAEIRKRLILTVLISLFIVSFTLFFGVSKSHASDGTEEEYYKYYKSIQIKPNDTLIGLAHEANYDSQEDFIQEVCFMNGMNEDSILRSGCYLVIPYYDTYHS